MTVSCSHFGAGGFTSYTSAAASPVGESVLDFLTSMGELQVGTAVDTGALVLPPLSR